MPLILILGSNNSGKSLFAEQLISQTKGKRCYIATMKAQSEDNFHRIEKHRKQREHLQFETLELPYQVGAAAVEPDSVVLLEDVSNLFANALFEQKDSVASVLADIQQLRQRCSLLVAVTISGLKEDAYDGETAAYIRGLNQLNQQLFEHADTVFLMENQQPLCLKGNNHVHS